MVMHCPAISATGVPIDFNNYNNLKTDLRHGVQVVGGSNPLAPTNTFNNLNSFFKKILSKIIPRCLKLWPVRAGTQLAASKNRFRNRVLLIPVQTGDI